MRQYQLARWLRRCIIVIPLLWMIFTVVDFMGVRDHDKSRLEILKELREKDKANGVHKQGDKEQRIINAENIDNLFDKNDDEDDEERVGIYMPNEEGDNEGGEERKNEEADGDRKPVPIINERGRRVHPGTGLEYPDDETLMKAHARGQQLEKLVELGGTMVEKSQEEYFANVELPPFVNSKDSNGLGEGGKGVTIDISKLTEAEKSEFNKGWASNSFNQYLSDRISIHRSLPDGRSEACKRQAMSYTKHMQEISVIIIFHNEAWTVLLRSVHSILSRTPHHLLKEIILVDDFSTSEYLKEPLEKYFNSFPKVTIVRASQRQGLTRARLLGFYVSTAPVLVFLDSHIECFPGWLEPLVIRIGLNHTAVLFPTIEVIADDNLATSANTNVHQNGVFMWKDLTFHWQNIPKTELNQQSSVTDAIRFL